MSSCGEIFHYFAGDSNDEISDNLECNRKSGISNNELSDGKAAPVVSGWLM
jgi:hypothetical protein